MTGKLTQAALKRELGNDLDKRFACITHSTGGPVVRDWWQRLYVDKKKQCPMSHLIMLAPANFGSALAQLGKSRLGRVKSWFEDVEPGQGVLDWLELGSPESWKMNKTWIMREKQAGSESKPVYPFVLTGQRVDRKLFDHLNSYTGEIGSDGVVRVAAANINASYLRLVQNPKTHTLKLDSKVDSIPTCFRLVENQAHSGEEMGILRSIKKDMKPHPSVDAILKCLKVDSIGSYNSLRSRFSKDTQSLIAKEYKETTSILKLKRSFIHDRRSMLIIRLRDDAGHPISDFDFLLTGEGNEANALPKGFFVDRQKNSRDGGTLSYFLNYTALTGKAVAPGEPGKKGKQGRGVGKLGMKIIPRPDSGFVYYEPAILNAAEANINRFIKKDQTTLVDIVLNRIVRRGAFELQNSNDVDPKNTNFTDQAEGDPIDKDL